MVINPVVGVYIPIIRIPIKGGMTISNIATFDHGTHDSADYLVDYSEIILDYSTSTCYEPKRDPSFS